MSEKTKKSKKQIATEALEANANFAAKDEVGVGSSVEGEMEADAAGNTYLPSVAPVVIKALVDQALQIESELKPVFASARDALMSGKDNLARLAHENIQHFSEPDADGKRVYKAGGVIIEITFEKEKITTKVEQED